MFVSVNECELYVEDLGPRDATAIIGHHGGPGVSDHRSVKRAYEALTDEYRLIVFDARGCGRSQLREPYTHGQWAADVVALADQLEVPSFVMAGGSYGGFIALEVAIRHPDRVQALVLRDTAADNTFLPQAVDNALSSPRVELDRAMLDRLMTGRMSSDDDLRDGFASLLPLYDLEPDPARDRWRLEGVFHHETHNHAFSNNVPRYDVTDHLPAVDVPALITAGRHDWVTPVEAAQTIHALLPRSHLRIFEHSGHAPDIEEAQAFEGLVRGFLAGLHLAGRLNPSAPVAGPPRAW